MDILEFSIYIYFVFRIFLSKRNCKSINRRGSRWDLIKELKECVLSYEYIVGVHDLIVHNYGPGRVMATIDAEIPYYIDSVTIHNIIDQAE